MNQKNKFVQKVKTQKRKKRKKNEVEFQQLKVHIISIVMKLDDLNKKIFAKFLYPNAYFQPNNIKK